MLWPLLAVFVLMSTLWLVSVDRQDASLVDRVWGLGFVIVAMVSDLAFGADTLRASVVLVLTTLWGVRLSAYLHRRNAGHGEDRRYAAMRETWGERFDGVSFWTVFMLQGAVMVFVSQPLQVALAADVPWNGWDTLGVALFAVGFTFEVVGDAQLTAFKARGETGEAVLDTGLWRYTRHPNYFGDALLWWGFGCFAAATGTWWTWASPAVMTWLLVRVSGAALLESDIADRRPAYADYIRRTSGFVPWPPRRDDRT